MSDEQQQAVTTTGSDAMAIADLFGGMVDLEAIHARLAAQSQSTGGSGGGSGYDTTGMVKIELSKDGGGRFTLTDPFTGDLIACKSLMGIMISHQFTLERWLKKGEVIEGIDPKEYEKKPLCRLVSFTDPVTGKPSAKGWFDSPAMSAYHAANAGNLNLGVMQATGGYNGLQKKPTQEEIDAAIAAGQPAPVDKTKCQNCPLAVKGLTSEEKHCKPAGVLEFVLFGYDGKQFGQPIKAFLRMPVTTIVRLVDDLDAAKKRYENDIKKEFGFYLPQFLTWRLDASADKNGGNTWGVVSFNTLGFVTQQIMGQAKAAVQATKDILAAAENANTTQANAPAGGGGFGGAQPTITQAPPTVPPATGGAPF